MKDKVSQIQKRLRRQTIDNYFKTRRMELLQYRERNSLTFNSPLHYSYPGQNYYGWKYIIINGIPAVEQESSGLGTNNKVSLNMEFEINLTSIEAGEYYLNILVDGAPYHDLEQTVYLLGKLTSQVLSPPFKLSFVEEKIQCRILLKILQQIKFYLQVGQQILTSSKGILFRNSNRTKKILDSLLDQQYRLLLSKQDSGIISELVDISYELSSNYMIFPNYQLVRYILTRIITNHNLLPFEQEEKRDNSQKVIFDDKIQELLMKFIIFLKIEENVNKKNKNVHHLQVIHQFNNFIEYKLINIYQFVKNHKHPFDYQHINNSLFFTLTLFTQIIDKFKQTLKHHVWETPPALTIVKSSIIDRIYDITYLHSRCVIVERERDQFILTIEQTVSKIFRYVIEQMGELGTSFCRPYHQIEEWQINTNDGYLLDILTLIKQCLREMQQILSRK